ncbi:hypothetical protein CTheo_5541 [Ceratobasidium theobromae]|uniref:Uncharacterized protein n=1 Tax=Ceratobasidium theobromae TaxID=1582974 RepID=A0A5N5QHK2_9AGAM|nr:hypothetical protein CTheo_5541 [Ceratobasidium theobromae]
MGVHGLTTFLRENRRALSRVELFSGKLVSERNTYIPLVVDAWSIIFALYANSGLPWVYGGEYEAFAKCVQDLVHAWLAVGLEPYFVFDGPVPLAKIPTTLKRLTDTGIHNANIFFRTSAAARSTSSFLASTRMLPPLTLEACLGALKELQSQSTESKVHIVMADGEADPFCVALADALGSGLVTGMDSDFAVLCTEGYGGYIPIDEMVWQSDEPTQTQINESNDGFTAVVTKTRNKRKSSGLIPPSGSSPLELSLQVSVYHPHKLAAYLQLPPALLPLFSALVGNDFSNPQHGRKFFENRSTPTERIWKVARAVSATIKKSQTRSQGREDAVLDVIHTAVTHLLIRPDLITSGEMDKIVDSTVEAALECTIPSDRGAYSSSSACTLHFKDGCPLVSSLGDNGAALVRAYRAGRLHYRLLGAVTNGIALPKIFLEDPDQKSCTAVTDNIWSWIWAVLASGEHVSLPLPEVTTNIARFTGDDESDSRVDDDSELISVVEDFTATEPSVHSEDLASELKERLKSLAGSCDDIPDGQQKDGNKSLMQYHRRGLKFVPEPVVFRTLSDLLPEHSLVGGAERWTRQERVIAFLEGMRSNTRPLRDAFESNAIDLGVFLWVCVIRCVVQSSAELAPSTAGSGGNAVVVGKWKKSEARSFIGSLTPNSSLNEDSLPPLDTRTIQRVAQLLYAFDAGARLAETLYLFGEADEEGVEGVSKANEQDIVGCATRMFSGRAVHAATSSSIQVDNQVWGLVCDGFEDEIWVQEVEGKVKKAKNKSNKAKAGGNGPKSSAGKSVHGFDILASLEAE